MSQGYDKLLDLRQRPWSEDGRRPLVPRFVLTDVALLVLLISGLAEWLLMAWSGIDWIGSHLGAGSWASRAVHGAIAVASLLMLRRMFRLYRSI